MEDFGILFIRGTPNEKICLEYDGEEDSSEECLPYDVNLEGDITITGIAELKTETDTKLLFKLSNFKIIDLEGNIYTPYNYPAEKKDKNGRYFPLIMATKEKFMENLKNRNLKLKYNGKKWEEVYFTDEYYSPLSLSKKRKPYRNYIRKKIEFLGVEALKLNLKITASYYYTIDDVLCWDFSGNSELC